MRRFALLIALFVVMCVATSQAKPIETILIDGDYLWADAGGQAVIDFFTSTYPDATVTSGSYSDTANTGVQATIESADLLVISRRTYSGGYDVADGAYYSSLDIPVIFLTSYVTRSSKIFYEGGENAGGDVTGAETTVTAAGAAFLGVAEGTYDWLATGADTLGTGSVGTGKILATVSGNNLAVFWDTGDTDASGRTQVGKRLLWNLNATSGGTVAQLPDTAAGLQAFTDAVKGVTSNKEVPYDPIETPLNIDGSVGTPINLTQAEVTLGWNAAGDPVNPDILGHNIYLSHGIEGDDPNVYLVDYILQVHDADPSLTEPYNEYGPITVNRGVTYYWQIEEVMDDGGTGYPAGDPNNILGPLWSFSVIPALVSITAVEPAYNVVEAGNNHVLTVTGAAVDTYQWYKIGDPDVALVNGADYDGVDTNTLTIFDVQLADEGYYYCIGANSLPSSASNRDTGPARVMTKRLMSHYPMETMDTSADPNGITPDIVNGFNLRMVSNDQGTDVPVLEASSVAGLEGTSSLMFDNPPGSNDPNNVYAQYAQIDDGMAAAYEDITISMWVYSNGGSNWNRIVDFGNDTNNYVFVCVNTGSVNGQLRFAVKVSGTEQSVSSASGALADNEWTFVTATLTGNTARLYVDGELVGTNTGLTNNPLSFAPTMQNWLARSQWGQGDGYFNGMVDDLRIYNYGLTGYDVAQLYLAVEGDSVCDWENYDQQNYDVNDNCIIDLPDFAAFAARWLENDRFYPAQ